MQCCNACQYTTSCKASYTHILTQAWYAPHLHDIVPRQGRLPRPHRTQQTALLCSLLCLCNPLGIVAICDEATRQCRIQQRHVREHPRFCNKSGGGVRWVLIIIKSTQYSRWKVYAHPCPRTCVEFWETKNNFCELHGRKCNARQETHENMEH